MCRNKEHGGRRCPSQYDPVKKALCNAKRRAKYKAEKDGYELTDNDMKNIVENTLKNTMFIQPKTQSNNFYMNPNTIFFEKTFEGKTGDELFCPGSHKYDVDKHMGIYTTYNKGILVDNDYFAPTTITGVIRYNNLDEESYKNFGFEEVSHHPKESFYRDSLYTLEAMNNLSRMELSSIDDKEKAAIRYFTSSNYEWINDALYKGSLHSVDDGFDEDFGYEIAKHDKNIDGPFFSGDKILPNSYYEYDHKNEKAFYETLSLLDNAMEKAPKKQRVVYRGLSALNTFLQDQDITAEEWLDDSMKLGQEIKFEGYQSSTPDFRAVTGFACDSDGGIIFEIRTPEGLNITSISEVETEKEILLPRSARYMVVGVHKNLTVLDDTVHLVQLVAINDDGEILDGTNNSIPEPLDNNKITI